MSACADEAPTSVPFVSSTQDVSVAALPKVTIDYVCARTFKVSVSPSTRLMLYSHTNRGVAFYQPRTSFTTYVDGQRTADERAWVDVGFHEAGLGIAAADTSAITGCATSKTEPAAGTYTLSHVCAGTWYVENRNPVAYRFSYGIEPSHGNMFVLHVPAATAEGPARLFFGTRAEKWRTISLAFGEREIARATPGGDTFERCRADSPS
jgi:hypothetical protein